MLGAFAMHVVTGDMMGPMRMVAFAALAHWLHEHGVPVAAVVIGMLPGPTAGAGLPCSMQVSRGDPAFVPERLVVVLLLASSLCPGLRRRKVAAAWPEARSPARTHLRATPHQHIFILRWSRASG